jgi:pyridoxamine 5'-phosphate oxidase
MHPQSPHRAEVLLFAVVAALCVIIALTAQPAPAAPPAPGAYAAAVPDPLQLAREWLADAVAAGVPEPDAAALATAVPGGRPSVRFVLMRGIDDHGARFYTNYGSRKARELDANPVAALALWWPALQRQLRLEGPVERLTGAESDAYFASRGRGSQLGAWASRQGSVIEGRERLEARAAEFDSKFGDVVPRPQWWGGFRLRPEIVEFWEGRPNRLHDRKHFVREPDGGWRAERLSP